MNLTTILQNRKSYRFSIFVYIGILFVIGGVFIFDQFVVNQKNTILRSQAIFSTKDLESFYLQIDRIGGLNRSDEEFTWLYPEWEKEIQAQGKRVIVLSNPDSFSGAFWFGLDVLFFKKQEPLDPTGQPLWSYEMNVTLYKQFLNRPKKIIAQATQATGPMLDSDINELEPQILKQLIHDATPVILQELEK